MKPTTAAANSTRFPDKSLEMVNRVAGGMHPGTADVIPFLPARQLF